MERLYTEFKCPFIGWLKTLMGIICTLGQKEIQFLAETVFFKMLKDWDKVAGTHGSSMKS